MFVNLWEDIGGAVLNIFGAEIAYRSFLLIKEYKSFSKHYPIENRIKRMIQFCFKFSKSTKVFLLIFLILLPYFQNLPLNTKRQIHLVPLWLLIRLIGLSESDLDLVNFIRSDTALDYATGMAANYFHGYINLQLPHKGDQNKGIRERISDYESKSGCEFAINRLLIIIPHSMHTKPKIESAYLERVSPLEVVIKDRAGVARPFKNDVYRFKIPMTKPASDEKKFFYISMEGATPLLSFYEAMHFRITSTPEMELMQREIVLKFYKSLKNYVKSCPDTRMECELFYYNDYKKDGTPTDIGLELMSYIQNLWQQET